MLLFSIARLEREEQVGLELREVDRRSTDKWDRIVWGFSGSTIFHTAPWLEIVSEVYNAPLRLFGIYEGNKQIGLFPAFSVRKGLLDVLASPLSGWATPYLGPLVPEDRLGDFMEVFGSLLAHEGIDYVEVAFSDKKGEPFDEKGFSVELRSTYILDIEPDVDSMWGKLDSKCRNMVRKAQRNEVQVVVVEPDAHFDEYYRMAQDVYERSNRPPAIPKSFFLKLWARLQSTGQIRVLMAKHKDRLLASAIFLTYKDTVYYWDGVSYREGNRLAPNNLIQWTNIEWATQAGYRRYDMLGADLPGVAHFKGSFGPECVHYTYIYKSLTPQARLGRVLYKKGMPVVRSLRRKLQDLQRGSAGL